MNIAQADPVELDKLLTDGRFNDTASHSGRCLSATARPQGDFAPKGRETACISHNLVGPDARVPRRKPMPIIRVAETVKPTTQLAS